MYDDFAVSVAWSKNCVDLMSAIRVMGRVPDPRTAELLYEFATKHAAMSPEPTLSTKDANVPEKPDSTSFLTPSENVSSFHNHKLQLILRSYRSLQRRKCCSSLVLFLTWRGIPCWGR